MSIIKVDYGEMSGGNVKSGIEADTAYGQDLVINTGLSEITHFAFHSRDKASGQYNPVIFYDKNIASDKYLGFTVSGAGVGYGNYNLSIGAVASAGNIALKSINGGTVTVTMPNVSWQAVQTDIHWFAD